METTHQTQSMNLLYKIGIRHGYTKSKLDITIRVTSFLLVEYFCPSQKLRVTFFFLECSQIKYSLIFVLYLITIENYISVLI